jgi:hypothetical protein
VNRVKNGSYLGSGLKHLFREMIFERYEFIVRNRDEDSLCKCSQARYCEAPVGQIYVFLARSYIYVPFPFQLCLFPIALLSELVASLIHDSILITEFHWN